MRRVAVLHDNAPRDGLPLVLSACTALAQGDSAPLVGLLAPEVEWWSQGVRLHRGPEVAARRFERFPHGVQVTGIRKGANVVVLEFSRPWWKRGRVLHAIESSLGLRADLALWFREDGAIRKIETREHVVQRPASA